MSNKKSKKKGTSEEIIGRSRELSLLKELFNSKKAEFIAVYGRRRIGKTFLIKNFVEKQSCVFFHITGMRGGALRDQLDQFAKRIGQVFYDSPTVVPKTSWLDAFEDLLTAMNKVRKNTKIVLFLDELPWMATPRSKLVAALELFWNQYWVFDNRIKLIVCGSATSWIIDNIINNKGGLHNRVTRSIHLKPFMLYEVEDYLKSKKIRLNRKQTLDLYIALGGVPLYWSYIRKGRSAHQVIEELCFHSDGPLVKEFPRLFESLFGDATPYIELIRLIAKQRYGIGQAQLITKSKLPDGGGTKKRLNQLEEAGFITSLIPYGHKDKGIYYVMDDEYCLFYLHWIEPNLKLIAKKSMNKGFWLAQSQSFAWKAWAGISFESTCYKHIDLIRRALNIDAGAIAATWRYVPRVNSDEDGAQVDLLFDRLDDVITICEIKYSIHPFSIDKAYSSNLLKKLNVFKRQTRTKKQLFLSMVTTEGLKPTIYSDEFITGEVTLEDLFSVH